MDILRVEKFEDDIVLITIDDPQDRVNKFSDRLMNELDLMLQDLAGDKSIRGLIFLSGKKDNFIVGADLRLFDTITQPGIVRDALLRIQGIFNTISALPFPTLAAIHGHCLGGGLEFALACDYRIATDHPKTSLGLPEVKLGLLPAAGGTQRLPRLIGLGKALPLMLEGRALTAREATLMGIVDFAVYPDSLVDSAKRCLAHLMGRPAEGSKYPEFFSTDWFIKHIPPVSKFFFDTARRRVDGATMGNYPAPVKIIECVEAGIAVGFAEGSECEAVGLDHLVQTPESNALRRLFFATTAMKKHPLASKARQVKGVGVLGSGLMGSGISTVTAQAGVPVTLKDLSWDNLAGGLKSAWSHFDRRAKKARKSPVERDKLYGLIRPTIDYQSLASADLVIEAVFEDLELKQRVLREVEAATSPECIFASNTSAIPISRIAEASAHPETVVGMHYFSPVPRMPLLEVVVTPQTADWVTATAVALGQKQGKTVIVVKDAPGFYTSRILAPFLYEAMALLGEGADIGQVDTAIRQFGFPVGPVPILEIFDLFASMKMPFPPCSNG